MLLEGGSEISPIHLPRRLLRSVRVLLAAKFRLNFEVGCDDRRTVLLIPTGTTGRFVSGLVYCVYLSVSDILPAA